MQKLKLRLNEENEIGFKLNIECSEPELPKPNIRFVITETTTGRGWTFKAKKSGDNVSVVVPNMKGIVQESQKYNGKLEVILDTKYFAPTEVDVSFIEPLKVEAAVVNAVSRQKGKNKEDSILKETGESTEEVYDFSMGDEEGEFLVESELIKKGANKKEKAEKKISFDKLSPEKKKEAKEIFFEECKQLNIEDPQKHIKEGTDFTKKRLKALMAKAVKKAVSKE